MPTCPASVKRAGEEEDLVRTNKGRVGDLPHDGEVDRIDDRDLVRVLRGDIDEAIWPAATPCGSSPTWT